MPFHEISRTGTQSGHTERRRAMPPVCRPAQPHSSLHEMKITSFRWKQKMRLRTFDDGGRLFVSECRRYQRPMSVGFPTNRRDYIIFPGVFTSTRLRLFPTTARAHPSCDRMRGSLRSGDMSLRVSVAPTPLSVERELDPPASASGRRGLRPSSDTWRWRPRHRICLPFPTTARALPSCDRLRGSLRSGDMSLQEGRDSSRPRLSPPLGRNKCDPPTAHYHLPTTIYQLPSTNYHLPTTIYQLPSTNFAPRWEDANSHRNSVV